MIYFKYQQHAYIQLKINFKCQINIICITKAIVYLGTSSIMYNIILYLMSEEKMSIKRKYTLGEEIFNSVSHGIGAGLSVAGTVVLIVMSVLHTNPWGVVSSCIYGASLIILYTMSTLYHSFTNEKAKAFFRIMDHNTIFLLIAGTYTPITLYFLNGPMGWVLFGIVWASAIFGIVMNSVNLEKARIPSIFCYIGMGWVVIFAIKPLTQAMTNISSVFLLIGGGFYTLGIIFYAIKKIKYFHSVWHLFTIAGSVFHYFSILLGFLKI